MESRIITQERILLNLAPYPLRTARNLSGTPGNRVNPLKALPPGNTWPAQASRRHGCESRRRDREKLKEARISPSAYNFLRSHWDNLFTIKRPFLFYVCHLRLWSGSGQHGRGLCQELQVPGLQSGLQGLWLQAAVPALQIDEYQNCQVIKCPSICWRWPKHGSG